MDETPVLPRHPLHTVHQYKAKLPQQLGKRGREEVTSCEGSETEGVSEDEVTEGDNEWTPKVTKDDRSAWRNEEEDGCEDMPSTQLLDPRPLAGVYAYVDVRSGPDGCENRSAAISHQLSNLGATVCTRFTKDVTHVVFKDGKVTTRERAEKKKVFLVSPLWVEASKRANDRVSEAKYPVLCKDGTDSPVVLGKIKRIKSMQPKELEEEISRSLERSRKRHKSDDQATLAKRRALPALPSAMTPLSSSSSIFRDRINSDGDNSMGSDEEENRFALPTFKLPGTPVTGSEEDEEGAMSATPEIESVAQRRTKLKKGGNTGTVTLGAAADFDKQGAKGNEMVTSKRRGSGHQSTKDTEGESGKQQRRSKGESGESKEKTVRLKKGETKSNRTSTESEVVSKKKSSLKQYSLNNKESKVTKGTQLKTKKSSEPIPQETNKENADSTSDLRQKDGLVEIPKKRRRVHFKSSKMFERKKPTLVLTSVQTEDQDLILSVVEKLGQFELCRTVCDTTTHVVCGSPRRTINILAATAMGCWVLSTDWVWKSVESGHWLAEEPYEMSDHFPSAKLYRVERQAKGRLFRSHLFSPAGSVFVSSSCTNPPAQQLERLLNLAGGKVTGSHRKADVCVGGKSWNKEAKSVTEQWILDSITEHQLLPLEDYLLDNPHSRAGSPEL